MDQQPGHHVGAAVKSCLTALAGAGVVLSCATPAWSGDQVEPTLPLARDGTVMVGPLGDAAVLPGAFPSKAMGAVVELSRSSAGDDGARVRLLAVSPSGATVNWANAGDFDLNLNPADPSDPLNDPQNPAWSFQRTSTGILAVLGGAPTYAWAPHAARGVLMTSIASLDPDGLRGRFVGANATGALDTERSGPAYNMIDGHWRPRPDAYRSESDASANGNLWIDVSELGDGSEGFGTVAAGWFPFGDGWIGGLVPGLAVSLDDLPSPAQVAESHPLHTRGPLRRIDFARSPESRPLPWLRETRSREVYSVFEGDVRVRGGRYTVTGVGDDAFEVSLLVGDSWERVAGVPGLHGMVRDSAFLDLAPGLHRLRVRHFQATRHWGIQLLIEGEEFVEEAPVTFSGKGAEVSAWAFDTAEDLSTGLASDPATGAALGHPRITESVVTWAARTIADASIADLRVAGASAHGSLLFTQPHANNRSLVTASAPTEDGWVVKVTDTALDTTASTAMAHRHRAFSFLAVDADDPRVVTVRVRAGEAVGDTPKASVARESLGRYRIRLPEAGPLDSSAAVVPLPDGIALVQFVAPDRSALERLPKLFGVWEQRADGEVVVEVRAVRRGGASELVDTDFDFLWLDGLRDPGGTAVLTSRDR